tara:strand:+ start:8185 stop:8589 length:405 start_codon:yes stop_codon:yes gene_type:complete
MPKRSVSKKVENFPEKQKPVSLVWSETDEGHVPVIYLADKVIELMPRPVPEFGKGERDAILVWINNIVAEALFNTPVRLFSAGGNASARNPDWDLLRYWELDPEDSSSYRIVDPEPTKDQVDASDKLSSDLLNS